MSLRLCKIHKTSQEKMQKYAGTLESAKLEPQRFRCQKCEQTAHIDEVLCRPARIG